MKKERKRGREDGKGGRGEREEKQQTENSTGLYLAKPIKSQDSHLK